MNPLVLSLLCLLYACQSRSKDLATALSPSQALIASSNEEFLLTALEHKLSPEDLQRLKQSYPTTLRKLKNSQNLTMQDIINMTKAGIADEVIVHEIEATRSTFFLTPEDEEELSHAGVSRKVILSMKDTVDDRY